MSTKSIDHNIPAKNVEEYIGDGVFVTHDGFQLWLRTGDDEYVQLQRIAMEPEVFQALLEYASRFGEYFEPKKKPHPYDTDENIDSTT